jgi:Cupin-like domain
VVSSGKEPMSTAIARQLPASRITAFAPVQVLGDPTVEHFRRHFFRPSLPAIFPRGQFADLPALKHWFLPKNGTLHSSSELLLDRTHLLGPEEIMVPLELTSGKDEFQRFHAPLIMFVEWVRRAAMSNTTDRLYLAQAKVSDLPQRLKDDFPAPAYVTRAGKGDIYDTNLWIGLAPTYTPLHRDPNPNIFVQLAGTKVVRLFEPAIGVDIFKRVQREVGANASAVFRGDEMMVGQEKELLEDQVWGDRAGNDTTFRPLGYEAQLGRGDGLFIPSGWWHSIKGVGEGITGSVSVQ